MLSHPEHQSLSQSTQQQSQLRQEAIARLLTLASAGRAGRSVHHL